MEVELSLKWDLRATPAQLEWIGDIFKWIFWKAWMCKYYKKKKKKKKKQNLTR